MIQANEIIDFWFNQLKPKNWWQKSQSFDNLLKDKYGQLLEQAKQGELANWRETAEGRLAEIIVLDQFSRNIYRDTPQAFAADAQALCLTQWAVTVKADLELSQQQRQFLYMPMMHSESLKIHEQAVKLYQQLDKGFGLDFELKHKAIIERFGRYPHRNAILSRASSEEEVTFLQGPNSSF